MLSFERDVLRVSTQWSRTSTRRLHQPRSISEAAKTETVQAINVDVSSLTSYARSIESGINARLVLAQQGLQEVR